MIKSTEEMSQDNFESSQKEFKLKVGDLGVKIIGIFLTLLTISIGIFQYFHSQSHENYMEFKRSIWQKQLNTYTEACRYAGLIAMNPNDREFEENVKKFGGLYWGEMIMVEDSTVSKAMKDFYYAIIDFVPEDPNSQRKLKYKANELAKACRISSDKTWQELKPKE